MNQFHTPCDKENYKNKAESRKVGFPMNFHGYISFILNQNVYGSILDDL